MTAITCICPPGRPPFDHLLESNPLCLAHRKDIQLVADGWSRVTSTMWRRLLPPNLLSPAGATYQIASEEDAYDILLSERETK